MLTIGIVLSVLCGHNSLRSQLYTGVPYCMGFPGGSLLKNPPANAGDTGLIPGSGRSPEGGKESPGQRSLVRCSPRGHERAEHDWVCTQSRSYYTLTLPRPWDIAPVLCAPCSQTGEQRTQRKASGQEQLWCSLISQGSWFLQACGYFLLSQFCDALMNCPPLPIFFFTLVVSVRRIIKIVRSTILPHWSLIYYFILSFNKVLLVAGCRDTEKNVKWSLTPRCSQWTMGNKRVHHEL